jgi:hypothetical protein
VNLRFKVQPVLDGSPGPSENSGRGVWEEGATAFVSYGGDPVAASTQEFTQVTAPISAGKRGNHEPAGELADAYLVAQAKRGDSVAYDRIVKRYRGFVRLKASSYFLLGGESDDLIQEGLVGLYKAVRDFRTDRESSFRNFAELCITPRA